MKNPKKKTMEIFGSFVSGNTKPLYFLKVFWIFHKKIQKINGNTMVFRFPFFKNIVFPLIFWIFMKIPKNL